MGNDGEFCGGQSFLLLHMNIYGQGFPGADAVGMVGFEGDAGFVEHHAEDGDDPEPGQVGKRHIELDFQGVGAEQGIEDGETEEPAAGGCHAIVEEAPAPA